MPLGANLGQFRQSSAVGAGGVDPLCLWEGEQGRTLAQEMVWLKAGLWWLMDGARHLAAVGWTRGPQPPAIGDPLCQR